MIWSGSLDLPMEILSSHGPGSTDGFRQPGFFDFTEDIRSSAHPNSLGHYLGQTSRLCWEFCWVDRRETGLEEGIANASCMKKNKELGRDGRPAIHLYLYG
jgi:hypothetical protein